MRVQQHSSLKVWYNATSYPRRVRSSGTFTVHVAENFWDGKKNIQWSIRSNGPTLNCVYRLLSSLISFQCFQLLVFVSCEHNIYRIPHIRRWSPPPTAHTKCSTGLKLGRNTHLRNNFVTIRVHFEILIYKLKYGGNKSVWSTMRLKWAFWDILRQFGRLFDEFGPFRLFYQSFPTIFSQNRLIKKKSVTDGQTLL